MSDLDQLLDKLRDQIPAKSTSATSGKSRKHLPAWRTNRATEEKALQKAFSRHKATTLEAKTALLDTIIHGYQHIARYRQTALNANEFVSQPRMLSVWLNADGWMDEFEVASSELKNSRNTSTCAQCGAQAHWRDYEAKLICKTCYIKTDAEVDKIRQSVKAKEAANPREPGETWHKWSKRMLRDTPVGRVYLKRIGEL